MEKEKDGQEDSVFTQLTEAVAANPDDPSLHFNLGLFLWEEIGEESMEKAAEHFVIAAKLNPQDANAFRYVGHYYSKVSVDTQRALKCYQRALNLDPQDSESGESMCDLLDKEGKESLEVAVCREASGKSPRAFWAFRRLGFLQPPFLVFSLVSILKNPSLKPTHHLLRRHTAEMGGYEVDDCRGVLKVFSDGSVWRSTEPSFQVPVVDDGSVLWKDVLFDQPNNLSLRLYKPAAPGGCEKLPVFYYVHGGGFCIGSRTWPNCQNYCFKLASALRAVVVAPDYRLAPENRLPLAVEDGFTAVKWLQSQAVASEPDPWLVESADFSRVFVCGDSAGGNIAHNVAVRLGAGSKSLEPVQVRGYVLLAPFFGGTVLTRSEAQGPVDAFLNWELIDRFWRLSIPAGDTMDHPLVNPFGPVSVDLELVELDPILVVCGGCDLLKDRAKEYAERLKNWGKKVKYEEFEGQQHGFFTINPNSEPSMKLMQIIKDFITQYSI